MEKNNKNNNKSNNKDNKNNRNNRNNRFGNTSPEKTSICSCGAKSKLRSNKSYPHGRKSRPILSQSYVCEKCGERKMVKKRENNFRRR